MCQLEHIRTDLGRSPVHAIPLTGFDSRKRCRKDCASALPLQVDKVLFRPEPAGPITGKNIGVKDGDPPEMQPIILKTAPGHTQTPQKIFE